MKISKVSGYPTPDLYIEATFQGFHFLRIIYLGILKYNYLFVIVPVSGAVKSWQIMSFWFNLIDLASPYFLEMSLFHILSIRNVFFQPQGFLLLKPQPNSHYVSFKGVL